MPKYKVKPEELGNGTRVALTRPEPGGSVIVIDLDTASQDELALIIQVCGADYPLIVEDKSKSSQNTTV